MDDAACFPQAAFSVYVVFIVLRLSRYGRNVLRLCSRIISAFQKKTQTAYLLIFLIKF